MTTLQALLIFLGGGLGSLARAGLGLLFAPVPTAGWPWHTWIANVAGCLLAGLLLSGLRLLEPGQQNARALLIIGFCGGFTTFSAFALELWLIGAQRPRLVLWYGLSSLLLSVLACGLGLWLGRLLRA